MVKEKAGWDLAPLIAFIALLVAFTALLVALETKDLTEIMAQNKPSIAIAPIIEDFYPGATLLRLWITNNGFVPVILWEKYIVKQKCGSKIEEIGSFTFSKFVSYKNPEKVSKTFAKTGAMAAYRAQIPPGIITEDCNILLEIGTDGINQANAPPLEIPVKWR